MRYAGIDVAAASHVLAIVDDAGIVLLKPTLFTEDAAGYARLLVYLGEPGGLTVVVEASGYCGRNLCGFLVERGFPVAV